jgi:hypothetical protein
LVEVEVPWEVVKEEVGGGKGKGGGEGVEAWDLRIIEREVTGMKRMKRMNMVGGVIWTLVERRETKIYMLMMGRRWGMRSSMEMDSNCL